MLRFVRDVNRHLVASFEQEVGSSEFELKEKFGRFSMDSIASCAFGVDAQSFTNGNSQFVKNARAIFRYVEVMLTSRQRGRIQLGASYTGARSWI